jgi:tetratricopeptide (TPR) repeat protein
MSQSSTSRAKWLQLQLSYLLAAVLLTAIPFVVGLIFIPQWTRTNAWVFIVIIVAAMAVMQFFANRRHVIDARSIRSQFVAPLSAHGLPPLPAAPHDFTGRAAELDELLTHAEGVILSGVGGVGKTALALVLADRLKARYPDAQFYLDLKGASDHPLSVADALAHVLHAYHPTTPLPSSEDELRELYRTALNDRRVLLLLDNAAGRWQVEPLLPPASCFLLITSRQSFALSQLHTKHLDGLSPADARVLLLKIAPRIEGRVGEIAKRCDYLPLTLRLAGSALAECATLTVDDYIQRLSEAQMRLHPIDAALNLSYDLLSEDLQHAWRALAVLPTTFDLAAATAVWNVEQGSAQDRLRELARYNLVEWDAIAARGRLHDQTHTFAAAQLKDEERVVAQRRHAQHFANVIGTANDLYRQGGEPLMQGLALFDLERANIEAGQAWSAAHSDEDVEAAQACSWYAWQGSLLGLRLQPRDNVRWLETGLAAARRIGDQQAQGAHLGNLGNACYALGDLPRAIEYHEQALALAQTIGDRRGAAATLGNLGSAYYVQGELHRAIDYHQKQRVIAREIGDRRSEGNALYNMSLALDELGDRARAVEYAAAALKIREEIGDPNADKVRRQLAGWREDGTP